MKLTELLTAPWAIVPDSLREMQEIYTTHLKGPKIDIAAIEARLGRPLANEQQSYTLREGGIAVLSVEGVLAPKANLLTQISGGVSTQMLVNQIRSAGADTRVKALVQAIDSPGGSVFGLPEWGAAVSEVAAIKPVVTVSDGTLFSAAYWGGSAANAIYLTGGMAQAGSIGVYARMGLSQPDPGAVEFVRGKYKRGGINGQAPSAEYMAYYESQLDYMYSLFVDTVAANRGTDAETVLSMMADGRTFIGQQAVDAGLVDGIATLDQIVERLATDPAQFASRRKATFAIGSIAQPQSGVAEAEQTTEPVLLTPPSTSSQRNPMDRQTLEAQHPTLLAQLQTEFTAAGATAERQRMADVRAQSLPGHEALIERLAADGTTTGAQAAAAVVAAERSARQAHAQAQASDAPAPVAIVPSATVQASTSAVAADTSPEGIEANAKASWDKDATLRAEFAGVFSTYLAYAKAQAAGQIKALKSKE